MANGHWHWKHISSARLREICQRPQIRTSLTTQVEVKPKFKWQKLAKYQLPEAYIADPLMRHTHQVRARVTQRMHLIGKGHSVDLESNAAAISSMQMPQGPEYSSLTGRRIMGGHLLYQEHE